MLLVAQRGRITIPTDVMQIYVNHRYVGFCLHNSEIGRGAKRERERGVHNSRALACLFRYKASFFHNGAVAVHAFCEDKHIVAYLLPLSLRRLMTAVLFADDTRPIAPTNQGRVRIMSESGFCAAVFRKVAHVRHDRVNRYAAIRGGRSQQDELG